jgi:hypothetical protein
MPNRTPDAEPTADELAAEPCPVERFAKLTDLAYARRTLPKPLSDMRLRSALASKVTATAIAKRAGVTQGRISQLARRAYGRAA